MTLYRIERFSAFRGKKEKEIFYEICTKIFIKNIDKEMLYGVFMGKIFKIQ